jgi:UDP-N-acetylmuramate dehydrogenase
MGLLSGFEEFVRQGQCLAPYTWLKMGGAAEYFAEPRCVEELTELVQRCREEQVRVRLLGNGSNLLVCDEGVPGVVIRLVAPAFCSTTIAGNIVTAGGGAPLSQLVSCSVGAGLSGLESLVGIPGTVGGALHGNVGSHGGDIGQTTCQGTVLTASGEIITRSQADLNFSYRHSSLDELVILEGRFQLQPEDADELTRRMQKLWIVKRAEQPRDDQPCGSIFKDPGSMSAAEVIDQAGLKGTRIGGAEVSDRNANFIVTDEGTTSQDVIRLMKLVETQVSERMGIGLERDIRVW